MEEKESDVVAKLRLDLSIGEKHLMELTERYKKLNDTDPMNEKDLKELKMEIKEAKKDVILKKELIMILGDEQFYHLHGDIFDRFLQMKGEHFDDEVIRTRYPLRGLGMVLFMELREKYYQMKNR